MMVAAFLVHAGAAKSAAEALKAFADERTRDGKGVTIPSQIRYVHYYEQVRKIGRLPRPLTFRVRHVRLWTIPSLDFDGGCDPYFDVRLCLPERPDNPGGPHEMRKIFDYLKENNGKVANFKPKHKYADLDVTKFNLMVQGDVKMVFFDYDRFSPDDKAFISGSTRASSSTTTSFCTRT